MRPLLAAVMLLFRARGVVGSRLRKLKICACGGGCRCESAPITARFVPAGGHARRPW